MKIRPLAKMPDEPLIAYMPDMIPVYPHGTLHGPGRDEKGGWIKPRPPRPIGWIGADGRMVREISDKAA